MTRAVQSARLNGLGIDSNLGRMAVRRHFMNQSLLLRVRIVGSLLCLLSAVPALAETIEGFVEFHGLVPPQEKLRRESDKFCAKKLVLDPSVRVNSNRLKDVWVRITKGAPEQLGGPERAVSIKQTECMYEPHVAAIQAGNRLIIENADPVLHNVHAYSGATTLFNRAMPGPGVITLDGSKATSRWNGVVRWKCDVHGWMTGFVGVSRNPYFAVSSDNGEFKIENVPPGKYSIAAWHEKFGEKAVDVSVEPGQTARAVFYYGQKLTEAGTH